MAPLDAGMMYAPDAATIDEYRELHRRGKFDGHSMLPHKRRIAELVAKHRPGTLLDYGCGKGWQYTKWLAHETWGGLMPTLYDPAFPAHATKPDGRFHGVICTDVAEHVAPDEVPAFLADVFGYAERFVFLNVCCKPAVKNLPFSGRNCHLTVQPPEWWNARIAAADPVGIDIVTVFE